MRFWRTSLAAMAVLTAPLALAESIGILVQNSPLAGSQYYAAAAVWGAGAGIIREGCDASC